MATMRYDRARDAVTVPMTSERAVSAETVDVDLGGRIVAVVEFDGDGRIVGLEITDARRQLPNVTSGTVRESAVLRRGTELVIEFTSGAARSTASRGPEGPLILDGRQIMNFLYDRKGVLDAVVIRDADERLHPSFFGGYGPSGAPRN